MWQHPWVDIYWCNIPSILAWRLYSSSSYDAILMSGQTEVLSLKICCCKIKASEPPTPFLGYEGLESLVTGRGKKKKSPHRKVPQVIFNAK